MDAGLAWTIAGSVAGVIAIPSAVVIGVMQLRQARKDSGAIPPSVFPAGVTCGQPALCAARACGEASGGRGNPQEPPGWQPRPDPMAALEVPGPGSRIVVRAVTGMRGVGKTQLAAAFARDRLAEGDGRLLAWIAAETSGGLLAGLAYTAEALALPAAGVDAQAAGLAVRHWLEADGTGCLMVLDNVTDPELIQPFLPVAGAARVIITSNQKSVEALGTPVGVEVFTEAEGHHPYKRGRRRYNKEPTAMSPTAGQLVTETFEYDGGRQVTAYVPPAPPEAIVFAGDGQLITSWGGVLEAADLPPTMIIGAHRLDDETLRIHEYSPGESTAAFAFDPERFAAHEKFFVEDVRRWAQSRFDVALPADRTAVFGVSASGELALAMGLRHPDIYGAVFCASPGGGYRPPAVMPSSLPRAYLVAGMQEPFFLENATRWADALRDAGADVVMTERVGSHGDAFWREEFPLMVAWAFGR